MAGKRIATILISLSLCAALVVPVSVAWAYFTSYATTKGSVPLTFGTDTEITEDFNNWTKTISITNAKESSPVFVRVKAFCGSSYELKFSGDPGWTPGAEGFYYFSGPVSPGASTPALKVFIDNVPPSVKEGAEFNVIVVYESTLALYDDQGNAYANWDYILDTGSVEGGDVQ